MSNQDDGNTHLIGCCTGGLSDIYKVQQCPLGLSPCPHDLALYSFSVTNQLQRLPLRIERSDQDIVVIYSLITCYFSDSEGLISGEKGIEMQA